MNVLLFFSPMTMETPPEMKPILQKFTETTRRAPSSNPLKLSKAVDKRCAPCSTVWSAWMKS